MKFFEILEFSPFPMVCFPLFISKKWENTVIGTEKYVKAIRNRPFKDKNYNVVSVYEVSDKLQIYSFYLKQMISCYKIESTGFTQLGETSLIAYFSDIYGFVYLDFKTLNGDNFIFTIKNIINK